MGSPVLVEVGPPCRTCGLPLLPFSRQVEAAPGAPEVWTWTCPGWCPRVETPPGRPSLALVEEADRAFAPSAPTLVAGTDEPHDEDVSAGPLGPLVVPGRRCPACYGRHAPGDRALLACEEARLGHRFRAVPGTRARLVALRGLVLGCDCRRGGARGPCHAEVLAAYCDLLARPRPAWRALLAEARARGDR